MKDTLTNLLFIIILGCSPLLSQSQCVIEGKINDEKGTASKVYLSNLDDLGVFSFAFDSCSISPDGSFRCTVAMDSDTFRIIRFRVSSSGPNYSNQDGFHDNTILLPIQPHSTLSLTADADSLFYSVSFPDNTKLDSLFSNLRTVKKDLKEWTRSALENLKKTKDDKKAALVQRYSDTVKIFSNDQRSEYARLMDKESNLYSMVYYLQEYFTATGNSYHKTSVIKVIITCAGILYRHREFIPGCIYKEGHGKIRKSITRY